ncbi:MAG: hypothetical protein WCZ10_14825, partial [Desulfobulbaceae bacterium]
EQQQASAAAQPAAPASAGGEGQGVAPQNQQIAAQQPAGDTAGPYGDGTGQQTGLAAAAYVENAENRPDIAPQNQQIDVHQPAGDMAAQEQPLDPQNQTSPGQSSQDGNFSVPAEQQFMGQAPAEPQYEQIVGQQTGGEISAPAEQPNLAAFDHSKPSEMERPQADQGELSPRPKTEPQDQQVAWQSQQGEELPPSQDQSTRIAELERELQATQASNADPFGIQRAPQPQENQNAAQPMMAGNNAPAQAPPEAPADYGPTQPTGHAFLGNRPATAAPPQLPSELVAKMEGGGKGGGERLEVAMDGSVKKKPA